MNGLSTMKNPKHFAFVLKYMETGDVAESYKSVYPGTKTSSAYTSGHRILRTPEAKALMETYIYQSLDESMILLNVRKIIDEMSKIAFGNRRNSQKVSALKTLGDWAGLGEGVSKQLNIQEEKLKKALVDFKSTFEPHDKINNQITNDDIENYLDIYGVEYDSSLTKAQMYILLKKAVKDYRKTEEYKVYSANRGLKKTEEGDGTSAGVGKDG